MPPGRPEGWQPGGRPESAVACLCPRASGGAPPGPAAWRSSLAFGGVSRNQSANRAFRGDVSCCRFREIWVTVATIISPSPMLLSPGRWRLSGRVFSHTCHSQTPVDGRKWCVNRTCSRGCMWVLPSCSLAAGWSPKVSRGGRGRSLVLPPARALGFRRFCPPACLSCCSEPGLCPVAVGSPPSANPPPHTSHEEAVQGRCSELSATSPREPPRAPTSGSPGRRTSREGPEGARFSSAPCTRSVLHGLFNPLKC